MDQDAANLPSYGKPPLVEVAISVQFEAPRNLGAGHLGAFWASVKDKLPAVRSVQPIPASTDDFDTEGQWLPPSLRFALTDTPDCRLQMTSADDQWMWQIQSDRLVVNWRKRSEEYPRYGATLDRFRAAWLAWCQYLCDQGFEPPKPHFWELTYVNRVPAGEDELWPTPSDWPTVFPALWADRFAAAPGLSLAGLRGQWVWEHKEPKARLYVEPKPGKSNEIDVLILSLTARGPIAQAEGSKRAITDDKPSADDVLETIEDGLNLGHRMIVFTFDALASTTAKEHWERHGN